MNVVVEEPLCNKQTNVTFKFSGGLALKNGGTKTRPTGIEVSGSLTDLQSGALLLSIKGPHLVRINIELRFDGYRRDVVCFQILQLPCDIIYYFDWLNVDHDFFLKI